MKAFAMQDDSGKTLSPECMRQAADKSERLSEWLRRFAWFFDALIIFGALAFAVRIQWQTSWFWRLGEISGIPVWKLLGALGGFAIVLLWISSHQYESVSVKPSLLQQQKLNLQDCAISALYLVSMLYLMGAEALSRGFVVLFLVLVVFGLGIRRLLWRTLPAELTGPRNVLIIGLGPTAQAIRERLRNDPELGYVFKGFVKLSNSEPEDIDDAREIIGTIDKLAEHVCRYAVAEIFLTASCSRKMAVKLVDQAHDLGINSRMILDHLRFGIDQQKRWRL